MLESRGMREELHYIGRGERVMIVKMIIRVHLLIQLQHFLYSWTNIVTGKMRRRKMRMMMMVMMMIVMLVVMIIEMIVNHGDG